MEQAAYGCNASFCHHVVTSHERVLPRDAFLTDPRNRDFDVNLLFEANRVQVVALSIDAWKADRLAICLANNAEAEVTQEFMLRLFHVSEED